MKMCMCMLMHATMDHEGHQPAAAPPPVSSAVAAEPPHHARQDARATLDERYARGDIDRQDYLQRREDLSA